MENRDTTFHWTKADLHIHTSEDPFDEINYSAMELIDRAHGLGFRVLAVTLHDKVFDDPAAFAHARSLGMLLIPAVERRLEGADVVILNLSREESEALRSFDNLRSLRLRRGKSMLVFAPHPFYRAGGSIGGRVESLIDCFDAVEHCHFYIPILDPNGRARLLADRHHLPLLATSDGHHKRFFGSHFSFLGLSNGGLPPAIEDVFAAIRGHRVRRVAPRGGWSRFLALLGFIFVVHPLLTLLPGSKRSRARRLSTRREVSIYPPTDEHATS